MQKILSFKNGLLFLFVILHELKLSCEIYSVAACPITLLYTKKVERL